MSETNWDNTTAREAWKHFSKTGGDDKNKAPNLLCWHHKLCFRAGCETNCWIRQGRNDDFMGLRGCAIFDFGLRHDDLHRLYELQLG